MKPDIRHWRDIDIDYLSSILDMNGLDAQISTFDKKMVGTGQLGDCIRFTLEYQTAAPAAPKTLIGKFPAEAELSRQAGVSLGIYLREIRFYQLLQPKARITTPDCYFAEIDEETHEFVLLMSDASPAVPGDQLKGITLEEAKLVTREAAKLHAAFWLDDTLNQYAWITNTQDSEDHYDTEQFSLYWKGFQDRYSSKVTPRAKRLGDAFCQNFDTYKSLRTEQQCLIHIDYRPDNMLFASPEGGKPLTVVDWQSVAFGPAATDIGNCFAGALSPELRRAHESELLDIYVQELEQQGGGPYQPDELKRHYVLGAYQHFLTGFSAAMFVSQTPRGDEMFLKMVNGAVDLIYDHGAEDWFD